jgi:hypothetical protein
VLLLQSPYHCSIASSLHKKIFALLSLYNKYNKDPYNCNKNNPKTLLLNNCYTVSQSHQGGIVHLEFKTGFGVLDVPLQELKLHLKTQLLTTLNIPNLCVTKQFCTVEPVECL